jgi:hypothetical protein
VHVKTGPHAVLLAIAGWTSATMMTFFGTFKRLGILRTTHDAEDIGLDATKHGGPAYTDIDPRFMRRIGSGADENDQTMISAVTPGEVPLNAVVPF